MPYLPQETIRKKRERLPLTSAEIREFAFGIADGSVGEGQIAAFAMAVCLNGMSMDERIALTLAMRDTGTVLSWTDLNLSGPVLDKHSTGGVGDVVSLMLGPMIAACGGYVPMISGRGLGHTGGTLDKLESVPGYNATPSKELFRQTVRSVGVAIIGQTPDLAPADSRFYATRDITATVESIDLITASILSKKLAAGLDALVMDVKAGNGAFMPTLDESRQLARSIAGVATGAGTRTTALITDMNQSLAPAAGNAVEVQTAIDYLTGEIRPERLDTVVRALAGELLRNGGLAENQAEADRMLDLSLQSGKAAEIFGRMVSALGGPADLVEAPSKVLPHATVIRPIHPESEGYLSGMDTRAIGLSVVKLGGGRTRAEDSIDPSVGFTAIAPIGAPIGADRPIAFVHATSEAAADQADAELRAAIRTTASQPTETPAVLARIETDNQT